MRFLDARIDSYEKTLSIILNLAEIIQNTCGILGLEPVRFLRAIAHKESTCGLDIDRYLFDTKKIIQISTRREAAYGISGRYFNEQLSSKWGTAAESSWGIWQVMYPNLLRFGFTRSQDPYDSDLGLANTNICANISIKMILFELNKIRMVGMYNSRSTLDEFADAWNSGNFRDKIIPQRYIESVRYHYDLHGDLRQCPEVVKLKRSYINEK